MGDKQVSVRTLPSGEQVYHHPDGTQVMLPHNTVSDLYETDEHLDTRLWLDAEKTQHRLTAVEEKRAAQAAGRPVPHDKSPV